MDPLLKEFEEDLARNRKYGISNIFGPTWEEAALLVEAAGHSTTHVKTLPVGLCGDRGDHEPHLLAYAAVADGPMWCHADQTKRLPFALEKKA